MLRSPQFKASPCTFQHAVFSSSSSSSSSIEKVLGSQASSVTLRGEGASETSAAPWWEACHDHLALMQLCVQLGVHMYR